ncbi:short-chain dehydrogenase [Coraliomargarita sinensis]|uniref:Short-chain dehydrogenase n=1 Tax=Coraliomargarita sinensis TaxID=2174842 RepID=A0A317ZME9_9BACT|nr:SDR family oxidoreductase [Coraliomargarita sinensis]PXA04571.1 short-chain dehydrogenase [Coraliomargarita sinensis]
MSYDIKDKIALVTGANRGIGKAIVESFLKHGVAKIYAGVRAADKAESLVAEHGDKIIPIEIDYEKPETIKAAAKTAGDVEVVVSNAGILLGAQVMADDVIETFQKELDVNVYGLLRMAHAFAPVLKANGGGAFVQLNSVASLRSFPDFATYPASKAASYSFTQALKGVFEEQGTAILSVHPGPIGTDMAKSAGIEETDPPAVVSEGIVEALKAGHFHLFPDSMAKDFEKTYRAFAESMIEGA